MLSLMQLVNSFFRLPLQRNLLRKNKSYQIVETLQQLKNIITWFPLYSSLFPHSANTIPI